MKRPVEGVSVSANKRYRFTSDNPGDNTVDPEDYAAVKDSLYSPLLQRKATEICEYGTDGSGYIQAKIQMKWPPIGDKMKVQLEVIENGETLRFVVEFSGACLNHFASICLKFDIGDVLQLGLRCSRIDKQMKKNDNGRYKTLPMTVKYDSGVQLKFVSKKTVPPTTGMVVDTWNTIKESSSVTKRKISNGNAPLQDDWFATPADPADTHNPSNANNNSAINHLETTVSSSSTRTGIPFSKTDNAPTESLEKSVAVHPIQGAGSSSEVPEPEKGRNTIKRRDACLATSAQILSTHSMTSNNRQDTLPSIAGPSRSASPKRPPPPLYRKTSRPNYPSGSDLKRGKLSVQSNKEQNVRTNVPKEGPILIPVDQPNASTKKAAKKAARLAKKTGTLLDPEIQLGSNANEAARNGDLDIAIEGYEMAVASASLTDDEESSSARNRTAPKLTSRERSVPGRTLPSRPNSVKVEAETRTASLTPKIELGTVQKEASLASSSAQSDRDPALDTEAGCITQEGVTYIPLNNLKPAPNVQYNVIGILASGTPTARSRNGEWSRRLVLVDPSNLDQDDLGKGFSIICFTKDSGDNVPVGKTGDVLLLRGILVSEWNGGRNGSAPSFKWWTWALFDPTTGKTRLGNYNSTSSTPSSHSGTPKLAFQPSASELQHCIRLGDWWRAVEQEQEKKIRESGATIHYIGSEDGTTPYSKRSSLGRVHRLIKDASPDAPPMGFFDCTVEILHVFRNDNGVQSVYVTDYTQNDTLMPVQAGWCSPGLADKVLKIEMWLEAATLAEEMKPGDYYSIPNVRMKVSGGGYIEATFSEAQKAQKLDVDELEDAPHLAELLRRKADWEKAGSDGSNEFPHRLFEEFEPDRHFRCTVEIITISERDECCYLYVTDYTARNDIAPVYLDKGIARVVSNDRIVKVKLVDGQVATAKELKPGDFVSLRNLRLRATGYQEEINLSGRLGGDARLIYKLDPKRGGSEELLALLERKKEWEENIRKEQAASEHASKKGRKQKPSHANAGAPKSVSPTFPRLPGTRTIKQVFASKRCPSRFRIVARIVEFYPLDLQDCVILRCSKCEDKIPDERAICTKCDDNMADTYVRPEYEFYFEIEDEEGEKLKVGVNNPECSLLKGLEPVDFHEDDDAFEEFKERLAPVIGNLAESHERVMNGQRQLTPVAPLLHLVVGSWPTEELGERVYVLMEHEVLQ